MADNIVEQIQKNLGLPPLHKIDPNTQQVKEKDDTAGSRNFEQAAIPTVLLGLYRYGGTEQGAQDVLHGSRNSNWLSIFYDDKKEETIQKVASYSNVATGEASARMERIAAEAVHLVKQNLSSSDGHLQLKDYITQNRKNILVYLPADLQLGYLLDDNTLDDRTNKMEGPMSNSMHFFENLFSGSTTEKNETQPD